MCRFVFAASDRLQIEVNNKTQTHLILPVGTRVVTRIDDVDSAGRVVRAAGAVGEVVTAPVDAEHSYRVAFGDGGESAFKRGQLSILKHYKNDAADGGGQADAGVDYSSFIIYRCVVGSRAQGLENEASDTDRRGIYLPPGELHWSLRGVPEQLENDEEQECYWELQKFIALALKANPNILECLYSPMIETATPIAEELLGMREIFLSKMVYQTFNGYVMSQFKKLEQDLRTKGVIRWKHAMHLIRLQLSGEGVLRDGFVPVDVGGHRDRLLAIRDGETSWEDVNEWRLEMHRRMDGAFAETKLPERPDYARANAFLVKARRAMV